MLSAVLGVLLLLQLLGKATTPSSCTHVHIIVRTCAIQKSQLGQLA
jgi:hypothetical protein